MAKYEMEKEKPTNQSWFNYVVDRLVETGVNRDEIRFKEYQIDQITKNGLNAVISYDVGSLGKVSLDRLVALELSGPEMQLKDKGVGIELIYEKGVRDRVYIEGSIVDFDRYNSILTEICPGYDEVIVNKLKGETAINLFMNCLRSKVDTWIKPKIVDSKEKRNFDLAILDFLL